MAANIDLYNRAKSQVHVTNDPLRSKELAAIRYNLEQMEAPLAFCEMLRYDPIAPYVRKEISFEEALDNILEMAHKSQMDPREFLTQFNSFYKATQNTEIPDLEKFQSALNDAEEGKEIFQTLLEKVTNDETLEPLFTNSIPKLLAFLEQTHKKMLHLTGVAQLLLKEEFRAVKRGFRDILLHRTKNRNSYVNYKQVMSAQFIKSELATYGTGFLNFFHDQQSEDANKDCAEKFYFELIHFRKDYLCIFSMEKVKKFVTAKQKEPPPAPGCMQRVYSYLFPPSFSHDEALSLLSLTTFHGTNGHILSNLTNTDQHLIPSGRLTKMGITPKTGELENGFIASGRNQHNLSATTLTDAVKAYFYASQIGQHSYFGELSEMRTLINNVERFRHQTRIQAILGFNGPDLVKKGISIRRLRLEAPWTFWYYQKTLDSSIKYLQGAFAKFKTTEHYKHHMPKALDPDGTLGYGWHDNCHFNIHRNVEQGLNFLEKSMTDPLMKPEYNSLTNKSFPIVFASNSLHPKVADIRNPHELVIPKACRLGTDIQDLFVRGENKQEMQDYLDAHELPVTVHTFGALQAAVELNTLAGPYFADICSSKKQDARKAAQAAPRK